MESESSAQEESEAGQEKETTVSAHTRKKKKRTLEELCASLHVEEVIAELPENE